MLVFPNKTSKLINSKCLRSPYTLTLIMQISHDLALIKLNLKNYLENKNKLRVLYLIKIDLLMPVQ